MNYEEAVAYIDETPKFTKKNSLDRFLLLQESAVKSLFFLLWWRSMNASRSMR